MKNNPTNPNLKTEIAPIIFIIIAFVLGIYFYQNFPEQVPTHWNAKGEINGYSGKGLAAFLMPVMMTFSYLLLLFLPSIDPKKDRYKDFTKTYHTIKAVTIGSFLFIHFYLGLAGFNDIKIDKIMPSMIGILFMVIGNYMPKIKQNWFMGIRTPWTLSNETVWQKTHILGGKIFMLSGFIIFVSSFINSGPYVFQVLIGAAVVASLIPLIYSYLIYKKIK